MRRVRPRHLALVSSRVHDATRSHASLIRAGRSHPITVNGQTMQGTRVLWTGPGFFSTMQMPILRGRDRGNRSPGRSACRVISELFARRNFGAADPIGRRVEIGGSLKVGGVPLSLKIVGISATARYGGIKREIPPVVYVSDGQIPPAQPRQVTYPLRTDGDPLRYAAAVRQIVHEADARVPVTNLKTQAAGIAKTLNQEIVFARLSHDLCDRGLDNRPCWFLRHAGVCGGAP